MEVQLLLRALGGPMRYRIYTLLLSRRHCVRSLSKRLEITESAVSQHLKVMLDAGLVERKKYGYHTHYLPHQKAADLLADAFFNMKEQSRALDRDASPCRCSYQKEEAHEPLA